MDFKTTIETGIDGLRQAVKDKNEEQSLDLALSLLGVFLQNQNRIACALEQLALESKLKGMAHAVVKAPEDA